MLIHFVHLELLSKIALIFIPNCIISKLLRGAFTKRQPSLRLASARLQCQNFCIKSEYF